MPQGAVTAVTEDAGALGSDRGSPTFRDLDRVAVYTTCPATRTAEGASYLERVRHAARWSDEAGCAGMLVYTDNGLPDAWIVAHEVIAATRALAPLVAVQPLYAHPFAVAKAVATFALLFRRRVALNFVAGGFPFDLAALGDTLDHDARYDRLREYASIVLELLTNPAGVTTDGAYTLRRLVLSPLPPPELRPVVMVSGSSEAGRRCARSLGAVAVEYPQPLGHADPHAVGGARGMRVGVLARPTASEAWTEAVARFPDDPTGRELHAAVLAISDSQWHHQLGDPSVAERPLDGGVYWLGPYRTYKTFCPYLVGSYEDVAQHLRAYVARGHRTIILDEPRERQDLTHAARAFAIALAR